MDPPEVELIIGDTATLTAVVTSAIGGPIPDAPIAWDRSGANFIVFTGQSGNHHDKVFLRGGSLGEVHWIARSGSLLDSARVRVTAREVELRSAVYTGPRTNCALDSQDRAWCWGVQSWAASPGGGRYSFGAAAPVKLPGDLALASINPGWFTMCGLATNGEAWCWGFHAISLGSDLVVDFTREDPRPVGGGQRFRAISVSESTCGLTTDDELYCWGWDAVGEFGNAEPTEYCPHLGDQYPCGRIARPAANGMKFDQVDLGGYFACGIRAGSLWCWGMNTDHRLGSATSMTCEGRSRTPVPCSRVPIPVEPLPPVVQIATGEAFACALAGSGDVYCWGHNGFRELGHGEHGDPVGPVQVAGGHQFQQVVAGGYHACGLRTDGSAWCWGGTEWRQTGAPGEPCMHGNQPTECNPVPALAGGGRRFSQLSAGYEHTCGVGADDGLIYCWGRNSAAELGSGHFSPEFRRETAPVLGMRPIGLGAR
jgi:alpha-tubulin suppressor-like RCC1 family protein